VRLKNIDRAVADRVYASFDLSDPAGGDPRFGETTCRLTKIVRAEPAASLFAAPR
jgi:hypothetical protein